MEDLTVETRPMIDGKFEGTDILSIDQYRRTDVEQVVELAAYMEDARKRREVPELLRGLMFKALMFEDSSRTAGSFISAASYLGAATSQPNLLTSSKNKGEKDLETVRAFSGQADALLIRHSDEDFMDKVAERIQVPFTNGGNGPADHPTQFLLDAYSFMKDYGQLDGLKITIAGHVAKYRVARSLVKGLSLFEGVELTIAAPDFAPMPAEIIEQARARGIKIRETSDLRPVLQEPGAVYMCRPAKEYCTDEEYQHVLDAYEQNGYQISATTMADAHPNINIYHASPHNGEIDDAFYLDPRAKYPAQEDNGLPTRMACLALQLAQDQALELAAGQSRRSQPQAIAA